MFDLGWMELLVIGVVALIVVGPKDLPGMFRTLGQFTAKIRRMAREFGRAMEDAADASGVKDAAKDLNELRSMASPKGMGKKALGMDDFDPFGDDDDDPPVKAGDPANNKTTQTAAMTEERAANAKKISDAMAKAAEDRMAVEAKAKAEAAKAAETDAS